MAQTFGKQVNILYICKVKESQKEAGAQASESIPAQKRLNYFY